METTLKYFRIDRREICFVHFIFEACDGLATVTTIDPELGIIKLSVAPGAEDDTVEKRKAMRATESTWQIAVSCGGREHRRALPSYISIKWCPTTYARCARVIDKLGRSLRLREIDFLPGWYLMST